MRRYESFDVFTPTKPARVSFVERGPLNDQLVDSIRTPGKQIVVYGHSGSGKTTLLRNKLHQLVDEKEVISRCTIDTNLENLIRDAFDQLGSFYSQHISSSRKAKDGVSLSSEYLKIKASWDSAHEQTRSHNTTRVVPVQLTPQRLVDFFGAARRLWVVEDFHKLPDKEKQRVAQIIKVFMDGADEHPHVKIILIGAAGSAREVIEYDSEMTNRVAEVYVPVMTLVELEEIVKKGEKALQCKFDSDVLKDIVHFSSGLAAVCHQLCLNACLAADLNVTSETTVQFTDEHIEKAIQRYLDDSSDTLKRSFDCATRLKRKGKYDNCKMIVQALAKLDQIGGGHNDILLEIRKNVPNYPASNLTRYLKELQTPDRGELLQFDDAANRYSFSSPMYRAYALVSEEKESKTQIVKIEGDSNIIGSGNSTNIVIGNSNINIFDAVETGSYSNPPNVKIEKEP